VIGQGQRKIRLNRNTQPDYYTLAASRTQPRAKKIIRRPGSVKRDRVDSSFEASGDSKNGSDLNTDIV
jgi:hypothetical protein